MKITADTNVLLRAALKDDPAEAAAAEAALKSAESIIIPTPVLCEFVWVLASGYGKSAAEIAEAVNRLANAKGVVIDRSAVETGLRLLIAGGDFVDGAIAAEGRARGGEIFVTFDRKAAKLIQNEGYPVGLLTART